MVDELSVEVLVLLPTDVVEGLDGVKRQCQDDGSCEH
jgi:hypothetical protein